MERKAKKVIQALKHTAQLVLAIIFIGAAGGYENDMLNLFAMILIIWTSIMLIWGLSLFCEEM